MKLELVNVNKIAGQETHLYDINVALESGLNVLLGKTLSGKTSLMRIMAGLDRPSLGKVILNGKDVSKLPVQRRNVAFVYQQFINYPSLNVFENIASPLRVVKGLSKKYIRGRVEETAELMQISDLLDRMPNELSGGQQQRTAIARALIKEADLLLMDEPLVNLDYKLREELRTEMKAIFEKRDAIVVYASTEPLDALLLGGQIIVLNEGRVVQQGATLDVFNFPNSTTVSQIFSDPAMNLMDIIIKDANAAISSRVSFDLPKYMSSLKNGKYRLGVRANHIDVEKKPEHLAIPAQVKLAEISGSETYVHLVHGTDEMEIPLISQLQGVHQFDYLQKLDVFINLNRLYVFDEEGKLVAAPPIDKKGTGIYGQN